MTTTQGIQKEMILKAPRSTVWSALTTPEGWTGWFSEGVEGEFKVGEKLRLNFGSDGICWGVVVEREELSSFAYKWHPGEDCPIDKYPESEMTTVRFRLEDHPDGTKLTLEESGFENLPESRRANTLKMNTTGWKWELTELQAFVNRGERQVLAKNEIVRERVYNISREKLWELVATPEGMKRWWVEDVVGSFEEGQMATMVYGNGIRGDMKVIEVRRPEYFSFRSHPDSSGGPWDTYPEEQTTLTAFTLTDVEGGTHLKVSESGFERIPTDRRVTALDGNSDGWSQVMDMIEKAVGGDA